MVLPAGYQWIRVPACYRLLRVCGDSSLLPERKGRVSTHRLPGPNESCRLPGVSGYHLRSFFSPRRLVLLPSGYHTVLLQCPVPPPAGINLREFLFSFPSSKGAPFLPAGHQTALVPTRYRLTSPPVILRVIFFLFVNRSTLVILLVLLPAGYQRYCRLLTSPGMY
jgi:hypothetical protein